ncbi:syntabulin isoform X2 [Austrofundulus limnaeus]|uniref:Syntabulin isoform X2 n=1 Tax=Austrofundulus limnaeus TaxID=52670 RepID=A0A2I4D8I8_AUSLI|nr:PREDICTED: syntabulin-like isoform X2 [Austrofundulus limnaeus]
MGPFQEYEEKKSPGKGSPRSRIPRLVLRPFQGKDKVSPLPDSPFSEEEGKECDVSSDHSKRTISANSFCSSSERSIHGSPTLAERKTKVKRVRVTTECSGKARRAPRHKLRSAMKTRGSEVDFSSSSSTGSLKTREILTSSSFGKKLHPRSHGTRIRSPPVFKPPSVTTVTHDAELYAPYRTPPRAASSTFSSSCNSSPTLRRVGMSRNHSCGENHGIRPPNPEQYLTPLQQKEVAIRHLKTQLLESESKVCDREKTVEDLKTQLSRMREDWIEEECHRVEAQLSLKEARKEIKQLRQVVETMKSSLMEKDKGIQKYFIDINIQNRKLESLLHSMELAQSGSALQDENTLDFMCDSPEDGEKKIRVMELGDQGAEAMADSGLLVNDEMANRADIFEQVFMSTAVDFSQDSGFQPGARAELGSGVPALSEEQQLAHSSTAAPPLSTTITISSNTPYLQKTEDEGIQTDPVPISQDLQALLLQLLKVHGASPEGVALSAPSSLVECPNLPSSTNANQHDSKVHKPNMFSSNPEGSAGSGKCCLEATQCCRFMEELDFDVSEEKICPPPEQSVVGKHYWSNNFLVDLVALVAPVLPTVAWLYSRHGVNRSTPVYNIAALIRGCCIMGLHSLRRVSHRLDV